LSATVLVAIDGSEPAARALAHALDLAKSSGARIHACYCIDYVALPGALSSLSKPPESAPDFLREDGERVTARARAVARRRGVEIQTHLLRGSTVRAILTFAKDVKADSIVMGTHGRTGLRHLLLGSVAEGVIRRASVPVTVVPPESRSKTSRTNEGGTD
jgi:nucleotide-binding universal stress UspA family protein